MQSNLNRMTSIGPLAGTKTQYSYRADGMRVKKILPGGDVTRSYYDGQMPVEEDSVVTGTSSVTRNFVGARGIEAIFTTTTSGTTTAFPLYDCHGNMVATVSRSGPGFVTSNVRTYDVWGGVRTGASTGGPKGRYVANLGHVQDDESGLIYMRARYYEPESGRFISEDPARDGGNWFAYCKNNPILYIDEQGTTAEVLTWSVIGTILAVAGAYYSAKGARFEKAERSLFFVSNAIKGLPKSASIYTLATVVSALAVASFSLAINASEFPFEMNRLLVYTAAALCLYGSVITILTSASGAAMKTGWASSAIMANTVYSMACLGVLVSMEFD